MILVNSHFFSEQNEMDHKLLSLIAFYFGGKSKESCIIRRVVLYLGNSCCKSDTALVVVLYQKKKLGLSPSFLFSDTVTALQLVLYPIYIGMHIIAMHFLSTFWGLSAQYTKNNIYTVH